MNRRSALLIFTSDNGREGKGGASDGSIGGLHGRERDNCEGGIRVHGIVRWPGKVTHGPVTDIPIINSDVFVTALKAERPGEWWIDSHENAKVAVKKCAKLTY